MTTSTPADPQATALAPGAAIAIPAPAVEVPAAPAPEEYGRRGRAARLAGGRDLTVGSVPRNLWLLAWPLMLSGLVQTLDHLAELVWAGFLGFHSIASVGVAQSWIQLFNTGRQGFDTATRAMVSRAIGAKDFDLANHIASQALIFNICLAWTTMFLGTRFAPDLLRVLGVSEEMVAAGSQYLQLRFVSTSTFALLYTSSSVLQAGGDTMTPMKAQFLSRCILIPLSPVMIFGWLGFPALGLAGAAVAASIGQVVGVAMTLHVLFSGRSRVRITLRGIRPDFPLYWRMVKLGAPSSWTTGERSMAQLLLTGVVAPFGDTTLAAFALAQRLQMFVNLGQQGVGQAAGVLVGQNLGAKKLDRARSTAKWALAQCGLISVLVGTVIFLFPHAFLSVFTRDVQLLDVAVPWMHIMVVGFMAMAAGNVFTQVFNTAGDTMTTMLVGITSVWFVQQPLARILSGSLEHWELFGLQLSIPGVEGLGAYGIAWAMVIAIAVRLLIYVPYFAWGPWYRKRVL